MRRHFAPTAQMSHPLGYAIGSQQIACLLTCLYLWRAPLFPTLESIPVEVVFDTERLAVAMEVEGVMRMRWLGLKVPLLAVSNAERWGKLPVCIALRGMARALALELTTLLLGCLFAACSKCSVSWCRGGRLAAEGCGSPTGASTAACAPLPACCPAGWRGSQTGALAVPWRWGRSACCACCRGWARRSGPSSTASDMGSICRKYKLLDHAHIDYQKN